MAQEFKSTDSGNVSGKPALKANTAQTEQKAYPMPIQKENPL